MSFERQEQGEASNEQLQELPVKNMGETGASSIRSALDDSCS
jgi:hypothetical protein